MDRNKAEQLAVDTVKILACEAVEKAQSGHPGMPMGMAPAAVVLWTRFLRHDPTDPAWPDRDRFILSAGHGSMLVYSLLHLAGYGLSIDDLKNFRQLGSRTPGHPEYNHPEGVETTTGPLGQGFTNGVGMAVAKRFLAAKFNAPGFPVYNNTIYAIVSDGDLMEGITSEAASLAGHLGLGDLVYLYDSNHISIEGDTALAFDTEDVLQRFAAYGWDTREVDGEDRDAIADAIEKAGAVKDKPSIIQVNTRIGAGLPTREGEAEIHGAPIGAEELARLKKKSGWDGKPDFFVPSEAYELFAAQANKGAGLRAGWLEMMKRYRKELPEKAGLLDRFYKPEAPSDLTDQLLKAVAGDKAVATRSSGGKAQQVIARVFPNLIGGSADLAPSTRTLIDGEQDFSRDCHSGRNMRFGVREHAMGGMLNGMALYGGLRPFGATFFVFSDYMRPAIRLAAISRIPVIYVFTHDSIFVGEDGPTHQPVEQTMALRLIPGLIVIRPADPTESAVAWEVAATADRPVAMLLSRHNIPPIDRGRYADVRGLKKGAYILSEAEGGDPELIIIATGSEVQLALEAQGMLAADGSKVRVVSMPSWELFEMQPEAYRNKVLPPRVTKRLVVEAGITFGWERYTGTEGAIIGMTSFGESGPWKELAARYGFTSDNVAAEARRLLGR